MTQAPKHFFGRGSLASISLSNGFEQLRLQLWRNFEGLVRLARENRHDRTFGERLPNYDDLSTDDGTGS